MNFKGFLKFSKKLEFLSNIKLHFWQREKHSAWQTGHWWRSAVTPAAGGGVGSGCYLTWTLSGQCLNELATALWLFIRTDLSTVAKRLVEVQVGPNNKRKPGTTQEIRVKMVPWKSAEGYSVDMKLRLGTSWEIQPLERIGPGYNALKREKPTRQSTNQTNHNFLCTWVNVFKRQWFQLILKSGDLQKLESRFSTQNFFIPDSHTYYYA